mmetsp:Transcript_17612/g.54153  ORF Transcript_17612/g.54153 Transcript_17612/m.54153 type:complete len:270 (-) Transcript_17612:79-888(-)
MMQKLLVALALCLGTASALAPTLSSRSPYVTSNGAAVAEPPVVNAADVARQLLEVANEKNALEERVTSLQSDVAAAKDEVSAAERRGAVKLSALETAWQDVVEGLKSQINDLGADIARSRLEAARDAGAAAAEIAGLGTELASTKAQLASAEKTLAAERAAAAAAADEAVVIYSQQESVASSLGAAVARRDAAIDALETRGVRALSKQLVGTAASKVVSGARKSAKLTVSGARGVRAFALSKIRGKTTAEWREACEDGVVSWNDFGVRL